RLLMAGMVSKATNLPRFLTAATFVGLCLSALTLSNHISSSGLQGLWGQDIAHVILYFSLLPRLAIAILVGATLGLSGFLLQQAMQNTLASPITLGVGAGARLALVLCTVVWPQLLSFGAEWVAFAGALVSVGLVLVLTWRQGFAPHAVVLAGLVINIFVGALASVFFIFHSEALNGVLWWAAGALDQQGWADVIFLASRLLFVAPLIWLLLGPLEIMQLQ